MHTHSQIFENVFSIDEINLLRQDQARRPVGERDDNSINKDLDYHLTHSVACRIIRPKLDVLIGKDHVMSTGSYKEEWKPFATHTDTLSYHASNYSYHNDYQSHSKNECVVLIPLVQDPEFKTVIFDIHGGEELGYGQVLPEKFLTSANNLDQFWFSHMAEPARRQITKLPVDQVFEWKLGNVVTWPRSALHCSTDFAKYGLLKKFIIMFLT